MCCVFVSGSIHGELVYFETTSLVINHSESQGPTPQQHTWRHQLHSMFVNIQNKIHQNKFIR